MLPSRSNVDKARLESLVEDERIRQVRVLKGGRVTSLPPVAFRTVLFDEDLRVQESAFLPRSTTDIQVILITLLALRYRITLVWRAFFVWGSTRCRPKSVDVGVVGKRQPRHHKIDSNDHHDTGVVKDVYVTSIWQDTTFSEFLRLSDSARALVCPIGTSACRDMAQKNIKAPLSAVS